MSKTKEPDLVEHLRAAQHRIDSLMSQMAMLRTSNDEVNRFAGQEKERAARLEKELADCEKTKVEVMRGLREGQLTIGKMHKERNDMQVLLRIMQRCLGEE
jgi:predicted  nucleic acid-binding Zn-ribbon protein